LESALPKLTAMQVRNFKEPGRFADGNGLFYEITKTGIKRWMYSVIIAR
jgi:hypothetical protein